MSQPLLFVIVLSNNRRDDVTACLDSLFQSSYRNIKVILVDNCSTDNSVEIVHAKYPQVQIILLSKNMGYAGNNNVGIQAALDQAADWILILNDDTVLHRTCLSRLIEAGEGQSGAGVVGPMVYHFDEPDVIQSAGGVLGKYWQGTHLGKDEVDRGQFQATRPVEWISGCAIMVRRAVIEEIGLLDTNYFMYWEETDWCIRAAKAGWKILHVPSAKIWHKGVNRNYQPKPYVTYYMTRNYLFTLAKYKVPLSIRTFAFADFLRTLLSWTVKPQWRNKREHRDAMWQGMLDFIFNRMGPMPS